MKEKKGKKVKEWDMAVKVEETVKKDCHVNREVKCLILKTRFREQLNRIQILFKTW